jgi:hypothetical protein
MSERSEVVFNRRCENTLIHPSHTYTQHWKKEELPFLPEHVAAQLPAEWDADYRCKGVTFSCKECGAPMQLDTFKMGEMKIFCPNEDCLAFIRAFWVDR